MPTIRQRLAKAFLGPETRALDNARRTLLERFAQIPDRMRPEQVVAQLREQMDPHLLANMIRELEYVRLDWGPPDEADRRRTVQESRYLLRTTPLMDYTINLWTSYLGRTLDVVPEDEAAAEVWQEFFHSDRNAAILGERNLHKWSDRVLRDGDEFLIIFGDESDGTSTVRVLDTLAVTDRITAPQDADQTVWYRVDRPGATGTYETVYYPDALAWLPDTEDVGDEAEWGWRGLDKDGNPVGAADLLPAGAKRADEMGEFTPVFIVPVLHNEKEGWRGWPLMSSGHGWVKEHDQFRINRADVARSTAAFVREVEHEGGTRARDAIIASMGSTLATPGSDDWERNPPPVAGSTLLHNKAVTMRQLGQGTAAGDATADGEALAWYALLAGKIFPHYAGLGDVSTWATARAMSRPQQLVFEQYRAFWASVWSDVARVVFSIAVRWGRKGIETFAVKVNQGQLLEVDMAALVTSLSAFFAGVFGPLLQMGVVPPEAVDVVGAKCVQLALSAAGVEDVGEAISPEAFRAWRESQEAEKAKAETDKAAALAAAAQAVPVSAPVEVPAGGNGHEPVQVVTVPQPATPVVEYNPAELQAILESAARIVARG